MQQKDKDHTAFLLWQYCQQMLSPKEMDFISKQIESNHEWNAMYQSMLKEENILPEHFIETKDQPALRFEKNVMEAIENLKPAISPLNQFYKGIIWCAAGALAVIFLISLILPKNQTNTNNNWNNKFDLFTTQMQHYAQLLGLWSILAIILAFGIFINYWLVYRLNMKYIHKKMS